MRISDWSSDVCSSDLPYLGQPEAIDEGLQIYRSKCYVCHHSAGARGPNLFKSKLSDEKFLETVINGRKCTQMPAFGLRLSPDEVWKVHAYVQSTRSEEHTSELQSLLRSPYAVFCLKKKRTSHNTR